MKHNPLAPDSPLPNDKDSEKSLIAACFNPIDKDAQLAFTICSSCLTPDAFYTQMHSTIWRVMLEEGANGIPITLASLSLPMMNAGVDMAEFADIVTMPGQTPQNFHYCLSSVANCKVLRAAFSACYNALKQMADPVSHAQSAIASAQDALTACLIATKMETGKTLKDLWLGLLNQMQHPETATQAIPTGIKKLDEARVMPRKGNLILIAALRHVGKTALARQLALNAGRDGHKVLCFFAESADMDEAISTMAASTRKPTAEFMKNPVNNGIVSAIMGQLRNPIPNIRIDTEPRLTVELIELRCRYLKQTQGLDVVFCDNLQYFASKQGFKGETREQSLSSQALRLKHLARELGIVIYLLCQLNDNVTADEEPNVEHLRESKGPAAHADGILLMSAPDGISTPQSGETGMQRRHLWNRKWRMTGAHSHPFEIRFDGKSQHFLAD